MDGEVHYRALKRAQSWTVRCSPGTVGFGNRDRLNRWPNGSAPHGPLAHSILQPVVEYFLRNMNSVIRALS
jgi:hypothetical protein